MFCKCGCGLEVKKGNKWIRGHNSKTLGRHHSEETKKKIGEGNRGKKSRLGTKHSEETRKKISEAGASKKYWLGCKHNEKAKNQMRKAHIIHGKSSLLSKHKKHKKQKCSFGCKSRFYELHHEPELNYDKILEWEGRLINVCKSCHKKIHAGLLIIPSNVGISWTKKDTEKFLRRE